MSLFPSPLSGQRYRNICVCGMCVYTYSNIYNAWKHYFKNVLICYSIIEPRSQYWYSQLHFNSTGFILKFPFHVLSSFLTASILICSINPTVWNQSSIPSAIFSPLHMISETQHRVPPQPYVASFLSFYPALACSSGLPCHPAAPHHLQFSSVTQSCLTLCYPVDCSIPGLLVHHQLPEFTRTHVIEPVMPSNYLILCRPLLLLPSIFPSIRVFSN